jgi:flagellin-specific chaperone FliS
MLIEAGLRFAQKTIDDWSEGRDEAAFDSVRRCRAIVAELLAGVDPKGADETLAKQVAAVYLILFRTLTEAQAERSEKKMRDVLGVLDIERETWRAVCVQMSAGGTNEAAAPRSASLSLNA